MKKYAIIKNNVVNEIILCKNKSSEYLNILKTIFKDSIIIELDESFPVQTNYLYLNNKFYKNKVFESWVINDKNIIPPSQYPKDDKTYIWDESNKRWQSIA